MVRSPSYSVWFTLGVVFTFDVSNGSVRDGDVSVDCGRARKSSLSQDLR